MISVNTAVIISFFGCIGILYHYGYKILINLLDSKIEKIKKEINNAALSKEHAHITLQETYNNQETINRELLTIAEHAQHQVLAIKTEAQEHLEKMDHFFHQNSIAIAQKIKDHTQQELRLEITDFVINTLSEVIKQKQQTKEFNNIMNQNSINLLEKLGNSQ
jgi:F0F1-type ATP synthase membrane subunit b/b'